MVNYAVLLGFGLFDQSNSKYKAYVDRFSKLVDKKKIDVVVLCGGHTDLKMPEKSEAGTIAEYLKPLVGANVKLSLEEESLNSTQSISLAKKHIDLSPANKVFLVSDSVRFFKYFWVILHEWFGLNKEEIMTQWFEILKQAYENPKKKSINIELKDMKRLLKYKNVKIVIDNLHKNYKNDALHVILTEVFEIESLYNPSVRDKFLELTKKKEEARAKFGLK